MLLNSEQQLFYKEQGYLLLESQVDQASLDEIKKHLKDLAVPGGEGVVMEQNGLIRALHGCHLQDEFFAKLICHPTFLGPAQQILGSEVYLHQFKVNIKAAFGGDVWPWHQDFIFWEKGDGLPEANLFNISVFLEDVTEFNGPLYLIPGSHAEGMIDVPPAVDDSAGWMANVSAKLKYTVPDEKVAELVNQRGMVSAKGPAGTILMFHPNVVHASVPNISPYNRVLLLLSYNQVENKGEGVAHPRPEFLAARDAAPLHLLDGSM